MDNTITIEEYYQNPENYQLIDIRTESAFSLGHIPGAIQMDRDTLLSEDCVLPDKKRLIFYCMFGVLSKEICEKYAKLGYETYDLKDGYGSYLVHTMQADAEQDHRRNDIEKSLRKTFRKDLTSRFSKAVKDYQLVEPGDRIAVCISGGKDSMIMAKLFQELKRRNKFPFELVFLCMDPGYSETTLGMIEANAKLLGIPLTMFQTNIFDSVDQIEKSPCYICARMRRGHLYHQAKELGCNKIALGHHFDDVIETTLMSILFSGQTQTMMPKLHSTNFEGMELIRPLYYIREKDIIRWRDANALQFIRCACHFTDTCSIDGDGGTGSRRAETKRLIAELKQIDPSVEMNIFRSMENIHLDTVIGYKQKGIKHHFLDTYKDS